MKTMKKYYRIFLLQSDEFGGQVPVLMEWMDSKSNWYDTIEDAEGCLVNIINEHPLFTFTILPVYEIEKEF